jgi:hypothetical protein
MSKVVSSKALPAGLVEGIFSRMICWYGDKFVKTWSIADPVQMKAVWAEDLADMTERELKRGLASCRQLEWPPSLPQFRNLCREPLDYEGAFYEAARNYGVAHTWSAPAVYWAAVKLGSDVRMLPYAVVRNRWIQALDWAMANRASEPVPPHDQARLGHDAAQLVPMPEELRARFGRARSEERTSAGGLVS